MSGAAASGGTDGRREPAKTRNTLPPARGRRRPHRKGNPFRACAPRSGSPCLQPRPAHGIIPPDTFTAIHREIPAAVNAAVQLDRGGTKASMSQRGDEQIICVRVFLSSTFRGLAGVRKYLRKSVFPEVELEYRKRGIGLSLVDLQWGITEEEALEGRTVELCLREIERCQPYFLGLVGVRSGWKPAPESCVFRTERIAQFCRSHAGHTITELEFLYNHSRLGNPEDAGILFLGRELDDDSGTSRADSVPDEDAADAVRKMVEETYGPQRFPEKIRSLEDLSRAVRELLIGRLEELTEGERFDRCESSIRRNRNRQALLRNSGFCREADLRSVLSAAQSPERSVIVIDGAPGSGKSTLLTCLYDAFRASGQTVFIRYKQDAMLSPQDLWESIGEEAGCPAPEDSWSRASAASSLAYLMGWFMKRNQPVVLLIDDIDAYRMPVGAKKDFLDECMNVLPAQVKLILTAGSGAFDPGWHPEVRFHTLEPLDGEAKRKALADLETVFGKRFGPEVTRIVLASEKCRNPEYLMWLVRYIHENAVFENLAAMTETAERELSLAGLIQRTLGISLNRAQGRAERLYACLALVPEGLTEPELIRLFPHTSFRLICMALGKLGSAIQYDQEGRIHLVSKTLTQLLLNSGFLADSTARYLFKRLLPVVSHTDPKRQTLIYTRLRLRSGSPDKLYAHLAEPEFCENVAMDRDLWNQALETAYRGGAMSGVIGKMVTGHSYGIDEHLYVLEWFADFLEGKGEYLAAIEIMKFVEAELSGRIGSLHYGMGAVYASLLTLYSKNRDFGMARLILRHMGFILRENADAGRLPPSPQYLRLVFMDAYAVYSQLCPGAQGELVSRFLQLTEKLDGCEYVVRVAPAAEPVNSFCPCLFKERWQEHYVIGQVLQPDDYLTAAEAGDVWISREEKWYIDLDFVGKFLIHNLPGVIWRGGRTERLDIREYNFLMDCQRGFVPPLRGWCSSRHVMSVGEKRDLDVYLTLAGYCPKRMGCAYGFDGKEYLIYGYHEAVRLDEAAYLFWLFSDGTRTTEEVTRQILGMFREPDTYLILKEAGQSIRQLYRNHLIWFDDKSGEGADA